MRAISRLLLLLMLTSTISGCAMCCGTDDYNYSAYGGSWQRHEWCHGRVGSAFFDPGYSANGDEMIEGEVFDEEELPEGEFMDDPPSDDDAMEG